MLVDIAADLHVSQIMAHLIERYILSKKVTYEKLVEVCNHLNIDYSNIVTDNDEISEFDGALIF